MAGSSAETIMTHLKTRGPQTAMALAERLRMTAVGVRQHLAGLEADGMVLWEDRSERVGRPKRYWRLSKDGHGRFPDTHAHLTLELITAIRDEFGADGLDRIIARRERESLALYLRETEKCRSLGARVRKLADLRSREAYMAEARRQKDGSYLLIENHCPVCAAARECQGLCRSELDIFRAVMGEGVTVERTDHILAGARRCAYRIFRSG